jgi:hypothetical protein
MSQFLRSSRGLEIVGYCTVLKRSMLLPQVAGVCALDDTFIQTCNRIQCPPTEGACTPGTSLYYTISYIRSAVNLVLVFCRSCPRRQGAGCESRVRCALLPNTLQQRRPTVSFNLCGCIDCGCYNSSTLRRIVKTLVLRHFNLTYLSRKFHKMPFETVLLCNIYSLPDCMR